VLAVFGINSDGLNLAVNMLILFLVVIYLALVYWTYMDAIRRIEDPMLVICATVASLFPFVGTILYVIVRPPEYLDDIRERELEMQAAEARLHELNYMLCPHRLRAAARSLLEAVPLLRGGARRRVGAESHPPASDGRRGVIASGSPPILRSQPRWTGP
jgi:hypothetical protein